MLNILLFLLALTAIICIHELGHLLAAKFFKVFCFEYSIGMGPRLYTKKFKETTFSIRALPIGGYVAMAGEQDLNEEVRQEYNVDEIPKERTLPGIAIWKRIIIFLAGIIMNFILGYLIVVGLLMYQGSYQLDREPVLGTIIESYPAELAGLKENDRIIRIEFEDGTVLKKPKTMEDVIAYISHKGGTIDIEVLRDGEKISTSLTCLKDEESGSYLMGVMLPEAKIVECNAITSFYYGFDYSASLVNSMLDSLSNIFRGKGLQDVSGPVGMYQVTSEAISLGFGVYLNMIALFSINIGLMNAIPIPALDGGRVVLALYEAIFKKPVNKKVERYLITATMMLLLAFMAFIMLQDIGKLIR